MQIDWKYTATTAGYLSLKAAVIKDTINSRRSRSKEEYMACFNWIICRAKHYAHVRNVPIHEILNEWEAKRTYWWFSYYKNGSQPKLYNAPNVKPGGINYIRAYYKRYTKAERKQKMCREIKRLTPKTTLKIKPRWSKSAKAYARRKSVS